jgi:acetoin utilization protein AcuB
MKIKDLMTQHVISVGPKLPIPEAQKRMKEGGFRRLPVLQDDELIGIVTDRDIREAMPSDATSLSIWEIHYLIPKILVKEIMTKNPVTVSQDSSVESAARLMLEHKIGGLPVMLGGKLVGMITVTDVLWAFLELSERTGVLNENETSTRGTVASRRA